MKHFPRSRHETSEPPSIEEISELLQRYWNCKPLNIRQAQSRRVYYVEWPHQRVMFRSNPGWDGPTPPPQIVNYVNHLSKNGAPAPQIIPTRRGNLYVHLRDHIISVESMLPGKGMDLNPLRFLRSVGQRLAQLHLAAETFAECCGRNRIAGNYVKEMFERSLSRDLKRDEIQVIEGVRKTIFENFSKELDLEIPWLMCRGDIRPANTLATNEGEIWFVDFDSAEYAPALHDLVMTRYKWLEGIMGLSDASEILRGYHKQRSLSEFEILTFPAIWASYCIDRITFLLDRRRGQRSKRRIQMRDQILQIPPNAISMAQDLLKRIV